MGLINVPDIQNLDEATPELWNSRYGTIVDLVNGNLSSDNIADSAITAAKIGSSAVTTGKINDAAVTPPKITNPYKFKGYRTAALTSSTSATLVQFDTETFDTNNNFDITTNKGRYTVPVTGYYFFTATVGNSVAGGAPIYTYLYKNGADVGIGSGSAATTTGAHSQAQGLYYLTAGDYMEVYFLGGSGSIVSVGENRCNFAGWLVSIT